MDDDALDAPDLPEPLRERIRAAFAGDRPVDPAVDRQVRAGIHRHFARRRWRAWWRRRGIAAAAAAAAIVLAAVFATRGGPEAGPRRDLLAREDVDRNGRVDILDAFALARRLRAGGPAAASEDLDLDGDGRTDEADVRRVAAAAVDLGRR